MALHVSYIALLVCFIHQQAIDEASKGGSLHGVIAQDVDKWPVFLDRSMLPTNSRTLVLQATLPFGLAHRGHVHLAPPPPPGALGAVSTVRLCAGYHEANTGSGAIKMQIVCTHRVVRRSQ